MAAAERYGSCSNKDRKDSTAPSGSRPKLLVHGPIFVENPDGSITEAVPSDAKPDPRRSKADRRRDSNADGDSDSSGSSSTGGGISMSQEVEFLYTRHERVFILLLLIQLILEALYATVFVVRMRRSIWELVAMYNWEMTPKTAEIVLWTAFVMQISYASLYYVLAATALWTKRPKHYQIFATTSLCGVVGLVFLAYVDKFNLPIFFLRLLAYIYSRFLQGLTASILLLPPPPAARVDLNP
eukprot:TRINITY_DN21962_c0_g1_i1.p1 TRINITY_DN21962_c0_g1~~TRINITY_DN21962_c0_g1_i1.p1  ORF type:complete len:241 (-),score=31.80 TRINITY_DN21962_c0_g1_i1:16-738(-)